MDLALRFSTTDLAADLAVEANDLARDDGLETAVLLSLFLDRRADDGDALPGGESDRRGWWGDALGGAGDDRIGSRLWLLSREKQQASVLPQVEEYAREALQWLVDDLVAEGVDVAASIPRAGWLELAVTIHRPAIEPVTYRFNAVWSAQGA